MSAPSTTAGLSLRQAALIAGVGLAIMAIAAPFAEFFVYTRLVVPGDIEQTTQNLVAHEGLFLAGILAYLVTFICDLLVAWALYVLLAPVNRSLSLLTAWFRVVYTAVAFFAMLKLFTVFRLLNTPESLTVFGPEQLYGQIHLLLSSFRYEWGVSLVLFGIHLGLLGYLVYRAAYIPTILGILLLLAGLSWLIYCLGPYLVPDADLGFLMIVFAGELVFMLWLLLRGWKIPQAAAEPGS